ncbi:MAG: MMPL family transporter [Planctomycetes bacterium]|nr:MMPL family transporter [Planctomycetota bacterium]
MFQRLGRFTAEHPWRVCALWVVVGALLALVAPHWDTRTQDDDIRFVPDRFTSVRAYQILEKAFPQDVFASRAVFALEREDRSLSDDDFRLVELLVQDLEKLRQDAPELKLGKINSYQDDVIGFRLISADQRCTLIHLSLGTPYLAVATQCAVDRADSVLRKRLALEKGAEGLKFYTTGAAGIGRDLIKACGDSLDGTSVATVILVVVVLLIVYRAPLLALVPLATIAFSVWVSLNLLAMLTLVPGVHLVNISKIFAIVILYGAGTDYCLFLISRYREELHGGHDLDEALTRSVGGVGEALAASAGTVMVGLGMMALAEFAKVRYTGPAIAMSLGVALLASLTLTPALLKIMGKAVFWPRQAPRPVIHLSRRPRLPRLAFWDWVSHKVAARPVLVWFLALIVLMPLVVIGMRVEPNYRATGELSPSTESLQGLAALQRHFTAGEIGPVTVLLTSREDWSKCQGLLEIDHLSRGFAHLPNVAEVRSVTQPIGLPMIDLTPQPGAEGLIARILEFLQPIVQSFREEMQARARDYYIAEIDDDADGAARYVTRLDVVLKSDPFDPESAATLKLIQTWLNVELPRFSFHPVAQAECYGITANTQDLAQVTEGDRHRVNALVLAAILAILLILVRRLWLAAYLLVTVLASYFAALGATVLAGALWTGAPLEHVDWRVPFFLFTILVAVGEDYNILLVSRALEERKKHGPVEGMRRALARTGGAITSCGLIMAGTFATLMLAGLSTLMQIGFALAFGVLVDTFVVRPFLVPAFAMIFWRDQQTAVDRPAPKSAHEETLLNAAEIERILDDLRGAA